MVYPPQHYSNVHESRVRSSKERAVIALGGVLAAAVIAFMLFSFTSSGGNSGNGCLNFTYAMVMGGEQFHACGQKAKSTCASPPHLGSLANGLLDRLPAECRKAGLPYDTSKTSK